MDNRNEQPGREDRGGKGDEGHEGHEYALLLVMPQGDYEDVAPERIAEDALRVMNHGWPEGFDIEISTDRSKSMRYNAF